MEGLGSNFNPLDSSFETIRENDTQLENVKKYFELAQDGQNQTENDTI